MKIHAVIASALMLSVVATPVSAQVLTVGQVTARCPDIRAASACPPLATATKNQGA